MNCEVEGRLRKWIKIFLQVHRCPKFSNSSEKITHPAPPITSARVNLPPGTTSGSFTDGGGFEYRSDHDIAAGIIPNSSNTRTWMESSVSEQHDFFFMSKFENKMMRKDVEILSNVYLHMCQPSPMIWKIFLGQVTIG